jgi:hypothetical protein
MRVAAVVEVPADSADVHVGSIVRGEMLARGVDTPDYWHA